MTAAIILLLKPKKGCQTQALPPSRRRNSIIHTMCIQTLLLQLHDFTTPSTITPNRGLSVTPLLNPPNPMSTMLPPPPILPQPYEAATQRLPAIGGNKPEFQLCSSAGLSCPQRNSRRSAVSPLLPVAVSAWTCRKVRGNDFSTAEGVCYFE